MERLIKIMRDTGTTQYQLAKALNARTSTVNGWFKGRAVPRDKYLDKIAAYFNVSSAWLRYGDKAYAPTMHDDIIKIAETLEAYIEKHPGEMSRIKAIVGAVTGENGTDNFFQKKGRKTA